MTFQTKSSLIAFYYDCQQDSMQLSKKLLSHLSCAVLCIATYIYRSPSIYVGASPQSQHSKDHTGFTGDSQQTSSDKDDFPNFSILVKEQVSQMLLYPVEKCLCWLRRGNWSCSSETSGQPCKILVSHHKYGNIRERRNKRWALHCYSPTSWSFA